MKKEFLLVAILGAIIIILIAVLVFLPAKDAKNQQKVEGIQVNFPKENQEIFSPVKISGITNGGGWNGFEGQVGTVKLLDANGKQLGETAILTATTDWMKPSVSFGANLSFVSDKDQNGTLVFNNENPSGLPDKEKQFAVSVKIKKTSTTSLKVFFGNLALSSSSEQDDCKRVYAVEKIVQKTESVAKNALEELLKGPTDQEKSQGYFSSIPAGSKLNTIKIENGTAFADFNATTESGGGSCSMASRVAQITQTLKQFDSVKNIIISINGRTGDIFQP